MGLSTKRRIIAALVAPVLLLAACGNDDDDSAIDPVEVDDTADDDNGTADDGADDEVDDDGPNEPLPDDELPGESFDLFPYEGAEMTVVGVEADDVLNVRAGPGPEFDVLTTLAPLSDGEAVATGRNRLVDSGIWAELTIGSVTAWANTSFLLQSADTVDDTALLYPNVDDRPFVATGDDPSAALVELGMLVAAEYESTEEPTSTLTVVDGPHLSEMSEIIVDVIGLGDDSVGGYRVHVFSNADHEGYGVHSVETTTLCSRGVSEGMCV